MTNGNDLPAQVRAARKARSWTQADLAREAGVGERTIQAFETRESWPQSDNLRAILAAVDLEEASDEVAAATRAAWAPDIQVFLDMMGAFLSTMSDDERRKFTYDLTRQIFNRRSV